MTLTLIKPTPQHLHGFVAALERGWSPDNIGKEATIGRLLGEIARNADRFIDLQEDLEARGGPITLPDGSKAPRLPGFHRWLWDGEFCGTLGFRWKPGGADLPDHVLGHIGYAVVPWKRGLGYATRALALILPEVRALGLPHVELTTDVDNIPSQKVITANGGRLLGRFAKPAVYGGGEGLRFRIDL